jgi:O-antigen ligase
MKREALDRWCERGILVLVLAILVFTPLAFGGEPQPAVGSWADLLAGNPFIISEFLAVAVGALWLCRIWLDPGQRFLWPPVCWAVLAFAIYAVIRYLTADIEYVARQEMIRILVYALLFFAILNNLHRQEAMQVVSLTLIFLAMAISLFAIFQFLSGSDRVWHLHGSYTRRGTGTYISPNHLGGFLEMILPLGLAYTLASRVKPVVRVLLGYASLVILAGICVTLSRGTWVSTAAALSLFFAVLLFHRSHRLPALVLLVLLAGIGFYSLQQNQFLQSRLKQIVEQKAAGAEGRTELWPSAIRMWREHVWWGVGPSHFDYRFRQYRPEAIQLRPDRAHNDYLNTLTDWGVAGVVLVASAWVLLGLGVLKTWRFVRSTPRDLGEKKNSNKFAFVLGASAGLAAILVHSAVDFNMHIPANALVAVALMALLASHLRFATERYWLGLGAPFKALASLVVLAGLVYLGWQGGRQAMETVWLQRASLADFQSPAQVAAFKRAFAAEPRNAETALAIGEALRTQSGDGAANYRELAAEAMTWFERSLALNRYDPRPYLGYGGCLDWLDRKSESGPWFSRAEELDPNGYFTVAKIGMHYVDLEDYAAARPWFERSLSLLKKEDNEIAQNYLEISQRRLLEGATNDLLHRLEAPVPIK